MDEVRVSRVALLHATVQIGTLFDAGIRLDRALEIVSRQTESRALNSVLNQVSLRVSQGEMLSRALARFPGAFPPVYAAMVRVGEETGSLSGAFSHLYRWMKRDSDTLRKVLASLTYPAFVLAMASALTLCLLGFVIPSFIRIINDLAPDPPWFTRVIMALSVAVRNPLAWLVAVAGVVNLVLLARMRWKDPVGRAQFFALAGRVPLLGPLLRTASLARYCSAMQMLLASGVPLTAALPLAGAATGNPLYRIDSERALQALRDGVTLDEFLLTRPDLYPPMLVQMVGVALQTAVTWACFERLACWYDEELNFRLEVLQALVEPMLMGLVAVVVGGLLLATLLPLQTVLSQLG
ncbi:MAG: type II secretion system F family protein [Candidatus Eremiobacterota bacterium]